MYIINNVSIIACVFVAILGAICGQLADVLNYFLPRHKQIFSKKNFKEYLSTVTPKYLLMVIHIFIFIGILLRYGTSNHNAIKFMFITPFLISAFCIDLKKQIIPNRLTLTIFEGGLIFMFIQSMTSTNVATSMLLVINMLQGMVTGGAIFLIITLIGGAIFGKETMGFGDVKLMAALGLYFGFQGIIAVAILAFLIAAVYSIGLLIVQKIRHEELVEYIAFGPFIVIASFVVIFVPLEILMVLPFVIFSFGKYRL